MYARFHQSPWFNTRRMPAAVNVRADCSIGLLRRGLGRLAPEDQNFAQSDQQRCYESEPSVAFHECLRECRLCCWRMNCIDAP